MVDKVLKAIEDRLTGRSLDDIIEKEEITISQIGSALFRYETTTISYLEENNKILSILIKNPDVKNNMMKLSEEKLKDIYDLYITNEIKRIPIGLLKNKDNVEFLSYYSISKNYNLNLNNRTDLINEINKMSEEHSNLTKFFYSLKLRGLMESDGISIKNSPLGVLYSLDNYFQKNTTDTNNHSLFDLDEKDHLHPWGINFKAPNSYYSDLNNVREMVYHILTENYPGLKSKNRTEIIQELKTLPSNLFDNFKEIGFLGLLHELKDSPLEIIKIYDQVYQERTSDSSLFDNSKKNYLEIKKNKIN